MFPRINENKTKRDGNWMAMKPKILNENDAVVLSEMAQCVGIPDLCEPLLEDLRTQYGRNIGLVMLGKLKGSRDERYVAEQFIKWAESNGRFIRKRRKELDNGVELRQSSV